MEHHNISGSSSRANLFDNLITSKTAESMVLPKCISVWRSRSHLEKYLLVLVASLLLCVVLSALLAAPGLAPGTSVACNDKFQSMCLTETCVYTASEMSRSLDTTVDPCEDFYSFSCGGWIKNNPIPEGKSMWNIFQKLRLQNQEVIRNALEKMDVDKVKSKAEQKARIYFDACMDANGIVETLGGAPLQDLIEKAGGWNMSASGFSPKKFNMQRTLQILQNRYQLGGLFNWAVGEDNRNSSKHVIIVDHDRSHLPDMDNYVHINKIFDAHLEFMTKISVLLGGNETHAKRQMLEVIQFEMDLANITISSEGMEDDEQLYVVMTVRELQNLAPFLRWQEFFNDAFRIVSRKIGSRDRVMVYATEYFQKLNVLVNNYTSTEKGNNTLNNYLMWQAAKSLSPYLSKAFRDSAKMLKKAVVGSEEGEELWRHCITDTNNAIGFAVSAMFVRESFHGEDKPQGEIMIEGLKEAFKKNFRTLSWMDYDTSKQAMFKADAITDKIGFPDYILNAQKLDKQYSDLIVKPNEYFQNNIKVILHTLKKNMEKLDKPVDTMRWEMTPTTVNAYYTPAKNQIVFPAGILQLPFYDSKNPKSINYGAMGVVMGHELTHAFDDQGREYDRFGNLNRWWNDETMNQFKMRTDCFKEQYSNYLLDGAAINGKQNLGENVADNGGLKSAFHAYVAYSKTAPRNDTLPGLNFTHRQLFFISFAQVLCSSMTQEAADLMMETDDHAISRFRVIGSVSNSADFSEEFNCPIGSKMNPVEKCEVW